jgi:oligopeptide transport system substrate-binding protein
VWTFTLVRGATFHDGTPVTASDFVYAWNRLCNPANGSTVAYHLAAVKGYDDMRAGKAERLSGLTALDERTLQVTLSYPFADFVYVVSHPTLAPVPQAAVEEDPAAFAEAPVSNGALLRKVDVRRAISLAINRRALCEALGSETSVPVDTFIPPAMPSYHAGAWQYCTYDVAQARALLARAGYPNGQGLPPISLSCNSSGGFLVASAITEDLALIGIQVETEFSGWVALLGKLADHDYQLGTSGWIADYPIIDDFVFPNFSSKSADNISAFANAAVDEALITARQIKEERSRLVAYQTIVRTTGDSSPVIPLYTTCHERVCSDRVHNLVYSAPGLIDFTSLWIDPK